eukprot:1714108-Pleurochrysis_carterae.AAC.2
MSTQINCLFRWATPSRSWCSVTASSIVSAPRVSSTQHAHCAGCADDHQITADLHLHALLARVRGACVRACAILH